MSKIKQHYPQRRYFVRAFGTSSSRLATKPTGILLMLWLGWNQIKTGLKHAPRLAGERGRHKWLDNR